MWERRSDGLKKLKPNAVPTIFRLYLKKKENQNNNSSAMDCYNTAMEENSNQASETELFTVIQNVPSTSYDEQKLENEQITVLSSPNSDTAMQTKEFQASSTMQTEEPQASSTNFNSPILNQAQSMIPTQDVQKDIKMLLNKQAIENAMLKRQLKKLRDNFRKLKKENEKNLYKIRMKQIFTDDQICALLRNSNRPRHWSNDTIIKALQLKFACGERGYELIRQNNIPLPSIRTLQIRLQELKFSSGILDEMFEFLKIKLSQLDDEKDKECSLVMDEMSIESRKVYDTSTNSFLGSVTLPNHTDSS